MSWGRAFISQDYGRPIYKHKDLPVYIMDEFDFFRCVEFNNEFYEKRQAYFLMAICGSVQEDIQSCFLIKNCLIGQIVL